MDTGPVYVTTLTDIDANETTTELLQRLSVIGAEMTLQVLEMINITSLKTKRHIKHISYLIILRHEQYSIMETFLEILANN